MRTAGVPEGPDCTGINRDSFRWRGPCGTGGQTRPTDARANAYTGDNRREAKGYGTTTRVAAAAGG